MVFSDVNGGHRGAVEQDVNVLHILVVLHINNFFHFTTFRKLVLEYLL